MSQKNFIPGKNYIGVGGGVLIFNEKGEILLMRRGKQAKNQIGAWSKPGGSIEFNETVLQAMKREIKEELDIEINIWGYLPHTDHIINQEKEHWVAVNYLADLKFGEPKNMEPEKCEKIEWFSLDNLPDNLVQNTLESVENYKNKRYIKV